jgi:transcriptional regulator with XRE-family HTH domain
MRQLTQQEGALRQRRKGLGISQVLLGRLVGVTMITVYLWERGAISPNAQNAEALEEVLCALEAGEATCPHGHRLGHGYGQHEDCRDCAHRTDCARYGHRLSSTH